MWRLRRGHDNEHGTPTEELLVQECTAYLVGRYAELVDGEGRRLPAWAWLNPLAHGSRNDLASLAAQPPHWQGEGGNAATWQRAVSYLAHEIWCVVHDEGVGLHDLQLRVLVPLELAMLSDPAAVTTPSAFVGAVMEVLHQRDAHRSHP